jgi:hypothetical protein
MTSVKDRIRSTLLPGLLSSFVSLINVAISRARGKLIVVADVRYFERRAAGSVVTKMVVRALAVGRREILRKCD